VANSPTTAAPTPKPPVEAHAPSTSLPGDPPDSTRGPRADEPKPDLKPIDPKTQVQTIADEQRARSAEIEKVGVTKWVEAQDQRTETEKHPTAVQGVAPGNPEVRKKS
jgi:hypothetical protein